MNQYDDLFPSKPDFFNKHKHRIIIALFGLPLLVLALMAIFMKDDASFSSATMPKPDKELFSTFYKDIMERMQVIDNKMEPFYRASSRGDLLSTVGIASDIETPVRNLWLDFSNISTPTLVNKDAQKDLNEAKDFLVATYQNKLKSISGIIEYSKKPSPYAIAMLKKNGKDAEAQMLYGIAALMQAGSKLGLSAEEITGKQVTK